MRRKLCNSKEKSLQSVTSYLHSSLYSIQAMTKYNHEFEKGSGLVIGEIMIRQQTSTKVDK